MSNNSFTQRVLGLTVAVLMTGATLTAIDGYARKGSLDAGHGANVVQLEAVVVTATRDVEPAAAVASASAAPVDVRLLRDNRIRQASAR